MNLNPSRNIEVCLTPALLPFCLSNTPLIVVVVDILRATTSICTAFDYGVKAIFPVAGLHEAKAMKRKGYKVAAEREGVILDFADYGNSAFNFMNENIKGETIVYSTTNGTQTIGLAAQKGVVVIGAFSNITALTEALKCWQGNVMILCSGWKNRFNLEDTLFAGAVAKRLLAESGYTTHDDATNGAIELWNANCDNIPGFLANAEHRERLRRLKLDDVIDYSFTQDTCQSVPIMHNHLLIDGRRIGFPAAFEIQSQNKL
ncbi:MAG: hypothetical protein A2X11_12635 [Bacteroidetes bacterium GWE2_42_24]|nr:MAG: hypothetical protein A2X11_12635 [Bacteroidetes bacterium GWE2_42_24]OFY30623.1 MAG: hypothetical protein A2X09_03885 [Bacteroidetes bacterium GWF2_43_11]